ncbi:MAG: hypothetical protein ACOYT4_00735 [Nanoarchaeota archaeon]
MVTGIQDLDLEKHFQVIDPSFKRILPYKNSGYFITSLSRKDYPFSNYNDLILGDYSLNPYLKFSDKACRKRPIGFNDEGKLVFLTASFHDLMGLKTQDFNPKTILCLKFKERQSSYERDYETIWNDLSFIQNKKLEDLVYRSERFH